MAWKQMIIICLGCFHFCCRTRAAFLFYYLFLFTFNIIIIIIIVIDEIQTQRLIKILKKKTKKCLLATFKMLEKYFIACFSFLMWLFIYFFDRFELWLSSSPSSSQSTKAWLYLCCSGNFFIYFFFLLLFTCLSDKHSLKQMTFSPRV